MHEGLSQGCYTKESKSKRSIINKTSLQKYSADVSEYNITELKDEEYKESSANKELTSYFNIFECGKNIFDRLDVTYEQACMATPKYKYYDMLLNAIIGDNNRIVVPLSNEKLRQAFGKVMKETEAEYERNINKITCDASFQSPI